ncbi:hypothetical protein C7T94_08295 [Pedobacter yulinensis]|uniref:Probable sensor domain-containing protein n=1 Tax=Pedobacter yulinensis TaxID=2126353 RepID=A0A2T3HJN5_9SPHI|nr:hypothetical protein [Pedobacter yulinensis]PST82652.1 hypothetical protein C7T94_08295 [Pedobacter yulinensis]
MKYRSTYEAAATVSEVVEKHFSRHIGAANDSGEQGVAPLPDRKSIESMIDAAFWASLRREEGHSPKISLAYLPPDKAMGALIFQHALPLTPTLLTKIAPGVERAGIHLGIWKFEDELMIWGTTQIIPNFCFVLDVSEPALLVIKHRRISGFGKFTNVAVLKGDQVKVVDERIASLPDSPPLVKSLLDQAGVSSWNDPTNVLIQLAVSMRAHGRGGSLIVVDAASASWSDSVIKPMQYALDPAFCGLGKLIRQQAGNVSELYWISALQREVEHLSGLTAVDGATLINSNFQLLAFGSKLGRAQGKPLVGDVALIEPVVGGEQVVVHPGKIGGTRHFSVAQFVNDEHHALGLVASQDGHFTVFTWSDTQQRVLAHRIDTLLL